MAPRTTTTTVTPADEARKALEERRQRVAEGLTPRLVTIEQRVVAAALRERDHVDGCPTFMAPDGAMNVEAYAERVIAPGPDLRQIGLAVDEFVVVVRCRDCGQSRYVAGYGHATTAVAAVEAFTDDRLAELAGDLDPDLDTTLE